MYMITQHVFLISHEGQAPSSASAPPAESDQTDQDMDGAANREVKEKEASQQALPEFGQYLYFLFCPTLIYRDQYPM